MSFLNPFLLFGAGAVVIPIVIHLLNKRKFQPVTWAAMRFIKASLQQNQRRMQIEDLLLLLLRCLLLLLLALALARPAMRSSSNKVLGQSKVTAVLLLDNSASMGMSDGVQTRFDKARKAAEQAIDSLPAGSAVAVFLASDVAQAVISEPTHDLNLARKVVREAQLSDRSSDIYPGIERALETLRNRLAIRKEIYLFTDGQANGWRQMADVQKILKKAGQAGSAEEVQAHVVLISDREERNLGVSALSVVTGLTPANRPLRFEVQVSNHGKHEARDIRVALSVDGEPPSDEVNIPSLPAGSTRGVSVFARFRTEGFHTVTARIAEDRMRGDDQRVLAVRAIREVRALLVDGNPAGEPRETETFFLRHALQPVAAADVENYFIKSTVIPAAEFPDARLDDYDVVLLANVPEFPEATVVGVENYLRRGGGLIIFPGSKINAGFYNTVLFKQHQILPASLGEPRGDAGQEDKFFGLQTKNYDHPIAALWNDPGVGTLGSVRFYRAFDLIPAVEPATTNAPPSAAKSAKAGKGKTPEVNEAKEVGAARIVLRFADGAPAIVERPWGLGRVVLFSSSASTAWNDLPVRPAFLPLMHRTLGSVLNRQDENLNVRVGQGFARRMGGEFLGREAVVVAPTTGKQPVRESRKIELVGGAPLLQFEGTDRGGAYDVSVKDPAVAMRFAAQPDPTESSLEELTEEDVKSLGTVAHVLRWSPNLSLREAFEKDRLGAEFWLPLLLLVLACAAGEMYVAQRFSRSK